MWKKFLTSIVCLVPKKNDLKLNQRDLHQEEASEKKKVGFVALTKNNLFSRASCYTIIMRQTLLSINFNRREGES